MTQIFIMEGNGAIFPLQSIRNSLLWRESSRLPYAHWWILFYCPSTGWECQDPLPEHPPGPDLHHPNTTLRCIWPSPAAGQPLSPSPAQVQAFHSLPGIQESWAHSPGGREAPKALGNPWQPCKPKNPQGCANFIDPSGHQKLWGPQPHLRSVSLIPDPSVPDPSAPSLIHQPCF